MHEQKKIVFDFFWCTLQLFFIQTFMSSILSDLQWRYATKKFNTDKKISPENIQILKEVLRLTPSSLNMQPWKFLIIENKALKEELKKHSFDQPQITDCSHLIVFCRKTSLSQSDIDTLIQHTAHTRNQDISTLDAYKNMIENVLLHGPRAAHVDTWARDQVFIALGNFLTACSTLHIDTCSIGGFDPEGYKKVLDLHPQNLAPCVVCAIGYRSEEDSTQKRKKVRFEHEMIIQEL